MKKVLFGFWIMAATVALMGALTGCGNGGTPATRTVRAGRGSGVGSTPGLTASGIPGAVGSPTNPTMPTNPQQTIPLGWGVVTPSNSMATRAFLSTDFMMSEVGNTANDNGPCMTGPAFGSSPCAIMFTVTSQPNATQYSPLTLQGGTLSGIYGVSQGAPLSNGFLTMVIWDSMTGTQSPDGTPYTPIPVVIPVVTQMNVPQSAIPNPYGYSVYAGGGSLNLVFGDSEGFVQISGQVTGNQLTGTVSFSNAVDKNTGMTPGQSGPLGQFTINVCDIIQCS